MAMAFEHGLVRSCHLNLLVLDLMKRADRLGRGWGGIGALTVGGQIILRIIAEEPPPPPYTHTHTPIEHIRCVNPSWLSESSQQVWGRGQKK